MDRDEVAVVEVRTATISWGWFLGFGIAWVLFGLSLLSARPRSIAAISFLVAAVAILAGVLEIARALLTGGWKWLHLGVGAGFVAVGIMALLSPFKTFVGLSILFGWYLVLKGVTVLTVGIAFRQPGSLWGLAVALGTINLVIGMWALGYPGRSTLLLRLWIGIGAITHGLAEIFTAFELRAAQAN